MLLKSIKNLKISSEIYYSSDDTLNMTGLSQRDKLRVANYLSLLKLLPKYGTAAESFRFMDANSRDFTK